MDTFVPAGHPKGPKVWGCHPRHGEFFRALSKIFDDVVKLLKGLEVWLAGDGDGWHILLMATRNPVNSPVEMVDILFFTGLHTSLMVSRISEPSTVGRSMRFHSYRHRRIP